MDSDRESRIRDRAHEIWEELGRPEGQEQVHWLQAEAELELDGEASSDAPGAGEDVIDQPQAPGQPAQTPDSGKGPRRRPSSAKTGIE
jgi:hypothetical protein